ncbi:hypothetical protein [Candidatus Avelusimicrobium luingense]|uniref:hypothetical protein n=1 Tax=Candidatus Avelusimicrobium luingense TaxID=3416211 RepID=UPI003D0D8085
MNRLFQWTVNTPHSWWVYILLMGGIFVAFQLIFMVLGILICSSGLIPMEKSGGGIPNEFGLWAFFIPTVSALAVSLLVNGFIAWKAHAWIPFGVVCGILLGPVIIGWVINLFN